MNASSDSSAPPKAQDTISFLDLGLAAPIQKALSEIGYETPTPIQAQGIPPAMRGQDVLGIAQTGTGKTAAFTLPVLHKLTKGRARARMPRCLIVCPTRELAAQVAENVELYGKHLKLEMALIIGGVSFGEQEAKLMKGVDILIATPGRLLDQFDRGKILLTGVQTLVVDEADRMLDMGFIPDIERIFSLTPFTRQVLFFSATMPDEIKRVVDQFMHQPETIAVARQSTTAKTVRQRLVRMPTSDAKQKRAALRWVIDNEDVNNGIVFCNRKKDVDIVAKSLSVHGHSAAPIHGDLPQSLRTQTLDEFKNGDLQLLVASDVAARGLDIPDVSHVFNYDVPIHSEDYVHRIGRTGRAGRKGDAIMFVSRLDNKYLNNILELIQKDNIEELEIPDLKDFPTTRKSNSRNKSRSVSSSKSATKRRPARTKNMTDDAQNKAQSQSSNQTQAKKTSEATPKTVPSKSADKTSKRKSSKDRGAKSQQSQNSDVVGFGSDMPDFMRNSAKD